MTAGLWQRKAKFQETITALSYEQQGLFELSQTSYEGAMAKARDQNNSGRLDPRLSSEYKLWENRWVRCAKELGQWDVLIEFGKTKAQSNPFIVLESSWRIPDWQVMKEALTQVKHYLIPSLSNPLRAHDEVTRKKRSNYCLCYNFERRQNEELKDTSSHFTKTFTRFPVIAFQSSTFFPKCR